MMPVALHIDDDCVGQYMTKRPEYNGMVGTITNTFTEVTIVDGVVVSTSRRYAIIWADGACSLQHAYQVRPLHFDEKAWAYACAAEVILRVSSPP